MRHNRKVESCLKVNGILLLDKSSDMTSNRALQFVKRLYRAKKAGHTGTLDLLATGLLPICFGEATKISQYVLNSNKTYLAEVLLGYQSTTGDLNGSITTSSDNRKITIFNLLLAFKRFQGHHMQTPPMYSAIKVGGQALYKSAKKGINVNRKPRKVTFFKISLKEFNYPIVKLEIRCSKGTYIRQFADDLGRFLGTKACLYRLRRLSSGPFEIQHAYTIKKLKEISEYDNHQLIKILMKPDTALSNLPAVSLSENETDKVNQGQSLFMKDFSGRGLIRLYNHRQDFFAIGEASEDGCLKGKKILNV